MAILKIYCCVLIFSVSVVTGSVQNFTRNVCLESRTDINMNCYGENAGFIQIKQAIIGYTEDHCSGMFDTVSYNDSCNVDITNIEAMLLCDLQEDCSITIEGPIPIDGCGYGPPANFIAIDYSCIPGGLDRTSCIGGSSCSVNNQQPGDLAYWHEHERPHLQANVSEYVTDSSQPSYIASPHYPNPYPSNHFSSCLLQTAPGSVVHVRFERFRLEEGDECQFDYLTVSYEHHDTHLCGTIDSGYTLNLQTHRARLHFFTDRNLEGTGFLISVWAEDSLGASSTLGIFCGPYDDLEQYLQAVNTLDIVSPGYTPPDENGHPLAIENHVRNICLETSTDVHMDCNDRLIHVNQAIVGHTPSPCFGLYSEISYNDSCTAEILRHDAVSVKCELQHNCTITVIAGFIMRECGTGLPANFISIQYQCMPAYLDSISCIMGSACDHNSEWEYVEHSSLSFPNSLSESSSPPGSRAYILSPNYPHSYPNGLDGQCYIRSAQGSHLQMQIERFHTEGHDKCYFDYLSVRTVNYEVHLCGVLEPGSQRNLQANSATLTFHTDNSGEDTGFLIAIWAQDPSGDPTTMKVVCGPKDVMDLFFLAQEESNTVIIPSATDLPAHLSPIELQPNTVASPRPPVTTGHKSEFEEDDTEEFPVLAVACGGAGFVFLLGLTFLICSYIRRKKNNPSATAIQNHGTSHETTRDLPLPKLPESHELPNANLYETLNHLPPQLYYINYPPPAYEPPRPSNTADEHRYDNMTQPRYENVPRPGPYEEVYLEPVSSREAVGNVSSVYQAQYTKRSPRLEPPNEKRWTVG